MPQLRGQAGGTLHVLHGQQALTTPTSGSSSLVTTMSGSDALTAEPARPLQTANALLPVLPLPLVLRHGPLLVTIHWWADGSVVAEIPACALYGNGISDTAALEDLASVTLDWARGIHSLGDENLGGALLRQWTAFKALVDVSAL
jgi:hypothetical protein